MKRRSGLSAKKDWKNLGRHSLITLKNSQINVDHTKKALNNSVENILNARVLDGVVGTIVVLVYSFQPSNILSQH
jgi:hypothetical protein